MKNQVQTPNEEKPNKQNLAQHNSAKSIDTRQAIFENCSTLKPLVYIYDKNKLLLRLSNLEDNFD